MHRPRRVAPTAYVDGGIWLFTSGGARAPHPDGGGSPGLCLDSPSSPLGRARSSWATPGPSHRAGPGWGSWLVRRCFPARLFYVGLRFAVFSRVPFLVSASDFACLVCTVQIKVISYERKWCGSAVRAMNRGHENAFFPPL